MKRYRRGDRASVVWFIATCLTLAGGAACAGGGAPLSQVLALALAAVGLTLAGCRAARTQATAPDARHGDAISPDTGDVLPDSSTPFLCGTGALPPGAPGTAGWDRCCLGNRVRACPPPPPTVACNYGFNETYCPDGVTCGLKWLDPCGTEPADGGSPDSNADSASDAGVPSDAHPDMPSAPDAAIDLSPDTFVRCGEGSRPADGGMLDGWLRCCIDRELRWCPPSPPNVACNYGQGQTFCSDGTCGWQTEDPCGVGDGGSAEVRP